MPLHHRLPPPPLQTVGAVLLFSETNIEEPHVTYRLRLGGGCLRLCPAKLQHVSLSGLLAQVQGPVGSAKNWYSTGRATGTSELRPSVRSERERNCG